MALKVPGKRITPNPAEERFFRGGLPTYVPQRLAQSVQVRPLTRPEQQDEFRRYLADPRVQILQHTYLQSKLGNADEAARLMRVSQESGYPAWLLQEDDRLRATAEQETQLRDAVLVDFRRIIDENPTTAQFLANPDYMTVSHDDIDNLVSHENALKAFLTSYGLTRLQDERSRLGEKYAKSGLSPQELRRFDELSATLEAQRPQRKGFAQWTSDAGSVLGSMQGFLTSGMAGATVAGGATLLASAAVPVIGELAMPITVPAASTAGFAAGASQYSYRQSYGSYMAKRLAEERKGQKHDWGKVNVAATANALYNTGVEMASEIVLGGIASAVMKAVPGAERAVLARSAVRTMQQVLRKPTVASALTKVAAGQLGHALSETAEEDLQDLGEIVADEWLRQAEGSDIPPVTAEQIAAQLKDTTLSTLRGMLLVGLPGAAVETHTDLQAVRESRLHTQLAQALNDTAAASKVKGRLPAAYRAFVDGLTQQTGVEAAYISPEAFEEVFNQEGISGQQAAEALGLGEEYAQAAQSGTDFQIPLPIFQAKLAGTKAGVALVPDTKFDPMGLSAREAQEAETRIAESQRQVMERAQEVLKLDTQRTEDEAYIHETLKAQLVEAGRPEREAEAAAAINAAYFTTMGERSGKSARELFDSLSLRVQKGEAGKTAPGVAQEFNQTAPVDSEDFRSWFGDSKVTDEQGQPLTVYHGTPEGGFEAFDLERRGTRTMGRQDDSRALHFTDNPETASSYSLEYRKEAYPQLMEVLGYIPEGMKAPDKAMTYQVYLSIQNPLRIEQSRQITAELIAKAKADGYDGIIADMGNGTEYVAFSPEQIKSVDNQGTWSPETPNIYHQSLAKEPRASIAFGDEATVVNLFETADPSSFMHESAHMWLRVTQFLAEQPTAPEDISTLWGDVRTWLGVKEGEKITRDQHETFAKAFEEYLAEGKAPTAQLTKAFEAFRQWLLRVYRKVTGSGQPVSAEVRSIFDRMLASDEVLADQMIAQGVTDSLGEHTEVSEDDLAALDEVRAEVEQTARARMLKQVMGKLLGENREKERVRREQLTEELTAQLSEEPVYRLLHDIAQEGAEKVRLADLKAAYPEETVKRLTSPGRRLAIKDGTRSLEEFAEEHGFSSGDEMIQTLLATPPLEEAVKEAVAKQIEAERPTRADIEQAAIEVIHNEKQLELLALEEQILSQKAAAKDRLAKARARAQAMRDLAKNQLSGKLWREARRFDLYLVAERRAARATIAALEKGDQAAANQHKYHQLVNAALVRESMRLDREFAKVQALLDKFAKRKAQQTFGLDQEELAQIDQLLARFGVGHGPVEGQEVPSLVDWAKEMEESGEVVTIPDEILGGALPGKLIDLTTEQYLDLADAVQNIVELGRRKHRLITQDAKVTFENAVAELVDQAYSLDRDTSQRYKPHLTEIEKAKGSWDSFHFAHTKVEFLMRWLDGGKDFGPWQRLLYKVIADANGVESVMRRQASEALGEIVGRHYTRNQRGNWHSTKFFIPELNLSLTKEELLALALNWGNEGNRDRIRMGQGWTDEQVAAALDRLEQNDWDFVQDVWDYLDSYWPLMQQMVVKMGGAPAEKVEAAVVETKFGEYRGGYYPIKADSNWSEQAHANESKESSESFFAKRYLVAATKKGHLKERAKQVGGRPVKLDLSVLSEHLSNVIHDLAFRPAIRDAWKLVNNKEVERAVIDTFGREAYRQLKPWLQDIASEYREPMSPWMKLMGKARRGATVANMGWKITVALNQPAGLIPMMRRLGPSRVIGATLQWYANPFAWQEKLDFIYERSAFMQERSGNFDRDVRDTVKRLVKDGAWNRVQESFFWFTGLMDKAVCLPGWMVAYEKAYAETGSDELAVQAADALVRQTQGSGYVSDLAAIQRGSEAQKLFTMFYSYFNVAYNLMAEDIRATRSVSDIPKLAAMTLYIWVLPAVVSELLSGRGPSGNDEEKKKWWLTTVLGYPLNALVGVRDVARAVISNREYEMSPAADAFDSIRRMATAAGKLAADPGDDEAGRRATKAAVETAGYWSGLPSKQLIITLGNILDYLTGEEADLAFRDLFLRRPQD